MHLDKISISGLYELPISHFEVMHCYEEAKNHYLPIKEVRLHQFARSAPYRHQNLSWNKTYCSTRFYQLPMMKFIA